MDNDFQIIIILLTIILFQLLHIWSFKKRKIFNKIVFVLIIIELLYLITCIILIFANIRIIEQVNVAFFALAAIEGFCWWWYDWFL